MGKCTTAGTPQVNFSLRETLSKWMCPTDYLGKKIRGEELSCVFDMAFCKGLDYMTMSVEDFICCFMAASDDHLQFNYFRFLLGCLWILSLITFSCNVECLLKHHMIIIMAHRAYSFRDCSCDIPSYLYMYIYPICILLAQY